MGLETGSQRSLDMINKRNGKKQFVEEHIEAVKIANDLGVAVDAFTMIYPWEDEQDLTDTTKMVELIAQNPVNGVDEGNSLGDQNNPLLTINHAMGMIYPTEDNPITIHLTEGEFSQTNNNEVFPIIMSSNINLIVEYNM